MLLSSSVILLICVGFSQQYTEDQLRSLLSYDCSTDSSIEVRGVPNEYTVSVISTSCTVYLTAPGEYNIPNTCKTYNYWGYQHGYPTDGYYRTTYRYYTTTQWYYTSTTDYYGEVDISVSHGTHSGIVGGRDHHEFRLICDSLHSGGKMYRVTGVVNIDTSSNHVLPTLSYRHQKQHRAGYYQYPDLRLTDSEGRSVYSTHTGQLIYLLISSHDPRYIVRPENCSARSTFYSDHKVELFDVHHSGCLLEPYLMEMFSSVGHGQSSVRAPVYSFHFPGASYVTFICNVRICTKSSYNCDLGVCKSKRAARDVSDDGVHGRDQLSVSLYVGRQASGVGKLLHSSTPAIVIILALINVFL